MVTTTVWGTVQDQVITFPLEVPCLHAATLLFSVPLEAAAALLPGTAFEVVETSPGDGQMVVAAVDYRDNPWGDYNEINIGFLAKPARGDHASVGSFVYRMPVNQEFTCEAGNRVMGFPKTVEVIDTIYTDTDVEFRLVSGGQLALALRVPRVAATAPPSRLSAVSYSYLDGAPYGTTLAMDMPADLVDPADVVLELGTGPIADELRSLGLPAQPDFATWGENLSATFHLGQPVEA